MPQTDPEALVAPVVARSPLIAVVTLRDAALGPPLARHPQRIKPPSAKPNFGSAPTCARPRKSWTPPT